MADPPFRVVSEQSDADIERKRTRDEVGFVLRDMAANLLRIARGAGKCYDLLGEMIACVKAFQEFRDAHGHWPEDQAIKEALEIDDIPSPALDGPETHWAEWHVSSAEIDVCNASLRIAAARLLGQKLQEDHGRNDLRRAIDGLKQAHEKRSAKYAAHFHPRRTAPPLSNIGGGPKTQKVKHILRYSDGTPVIVGRKNKKKPPGDEPGGNTA